LASEPYNLASGKLRWRIMIISIPFARVERRGYCIMGNDVRRVDIGKFCLTNNGSGENYEI
jgi:hypothetical protein